MRQIFIDTSAYFALTDKRDDDHQAAIYIMQQLIRENANIITTNYVIAETHALILKRIGYTTAAQTIRELYHSRTRIHRVSEAEEKRAFQIILKYTDKEFSMVDAMSFVVMEKLHLTQAFTFDDHFTQYGFTTL